MNKLIHEIRSDLQFGNYLSALALSLIIPDICAKALYGRTGRDNYIKWYDENIGMNYHPEDDVMPYLDGDVVYQLRCSVLHSGYYDLENSNNIKEQNKVDEFKLYVDEENCFVDGSASYDHNTHYRTLDVDIIKFCRIICLVAEAEYNNNKEEFDRVTKTKYKILKVS